MEIRAPETILTDLKAERGLIDEAYIARADVFVVGVIAALEGVKLKPGEETPVAIDVPNLPANANIHKITATLSVIDDGQGSDAQSTTVSVTEGKETPRTFQTSVGTGIRNLQIRLDHGSVFWTHPGAMSAGDYAIPDFSEQANAYLDKYQSKDGKVTLQFQVRSDAAGTVSIQINDDLSSTMLQTQSWSNPLDSTIRVDRTVKLIFNQVESVAIDRVKAPASQHATVLSVRLDAGGKFDADRLLGPVESHDGRQFATISQDFSVTQAVTFSKSILKSSIQSTGIAAYFEADSMAEFYLELQSDKAGSPASDAPLAKSNVTFTPADKNSPPLWTFAKFDRPAELKAGTVYWVVAKAIRGTARLGLKTGTASPDPTAPVTRGDLLLNRGGEIWKPLAAPPAPLINALVSLVYLPQADNQTAAVGISISSGSGEQVAPQTTAKTISIPITDGVPDPLTLTIRSRGVGSLTIANVIQEYKLS